MHTLLLSPTEDCASLLRMFPCLWPPCTIATSVGCELENFGRNRDQVKQELQVHLEKQGCRGLSNLSESVDNRAKIAEARGIEVIIEGMRRHKEVAGVQQQGCVALARLSRALANLSENVDNALCRGRSSTFLANVACCAYGAGRAIGCTKRPSWARC